MSDQESADQAFRAVEREVALLFRRGRARAAEMARRVHPELEAAAYALLAYVEESGRVRLTDIGLHFGIGKATISRQVKHLEGLGLVRRVVDPLDRRSSLVSLTADGAARYLKARDARMDRFRELMSAWAEEDVERFAELLRRFNELAAESMRAEESAPA
ncbi:MarR family transcriptional regulator [Kitasatospora sp. NPDC085879]|jgi:DNA-binding MarR family transcriptional regulator|uniref:MarR family winged helix-turn-helix transcriptional regulator n=1 Tax=Kitasatospora sp. NPDC085879 TaxID=3154769 RepID=UPI0034156E75